MVTAAFASVLLGQTVPSAKAPRAQVANADARPTLKQYVDALKPNETYDQAIERYVASREVVPSTQTAPGRYQIVFSPHARADTYLVDTETGKVWESVVYTDVEGKPSVWRAMDRIDGDAELAVWIGKQTIKKKQE
jgi:hypothetical protein